VGLLILFLWMSIRNPDSQINEGCFFSCDKDPANVTMLATYLYYNALGQLLSTFRGNQSDKIINIIKEKNHHS